MAFEYFAVAMNAATQLDIPELNFSDLGAMGETPRLDPVELYGSESLDSGYNDAPTTDEDPPDHPPVDSAAAAPSATMMNHMIHKLAHHAMMGPPAAAPSAPMMNHKIHTLPQHAAMGSPAAPPSSPMLNHKIHSLPQHVAMGSPAAAPSSPMMNHRIHSLQQQAAMGSPAPLYPQFAGQRSPMDHARVGNPWSSGLFDCGQDETNGVMTAFFPCVTFGQIAEILDEGETTCTLGSVMYIAMVPALLTCGILGSSYRKKLRKRFNIVEAPAEDWTVHLFCPCCALCQESRELQNRGIDPTLGWMGYLAQQQQQQTSTAPPQRQVMST